MQLKSKSNLQKYMNAPCEGGYLDFDVLAELFL